MGECMKLILEANPLARKILNVQNFNQTASYRPFKYIVICEQSSKTVLYNLLTREMIELDAEEFKQFQNSDTIINHDFYLMLVEKFYFVPVGHDDKKLCEQLIAIKKLYEQKDYINSFTILPTTDCNARCFYCYEYNVTRATMSSLVAEDVAYYIKKVSKGKPVYIRWFGGEPLYNYQAINIICQKLKEWQINYSSTMVTNGYLFDDELIAVAKNDWNLKRLQITLDGTEKIYNRIKAYIYDDPNPYDRVLCNIGELIKSGIDVNIRINMDLHNAHDLKKLVEELFQRFGKTPHYNIYPHLLYKNSGKVQIDNQSDSRTSLLKEFFELRDFISAKGMDLKPKFIRDFVTSSCMADDDSSIVVLPDGRLSKCEHSLGDCDIGTIYTGITNQKSVEEWKIEKAGEEKCKDCPIYPDCKRLDKCETKDEICSEFTQKETIDTYKKAVIHEYNKAKN